MAGIPENLADWTIDTVRSIVAEHHFEPQQFDYKEVLKPDGGEARGTERRATSNHVLDGELHRRVHPLRRERPGLGGPRFLGSNRWDNPLRGT